VTHFQSDILEENILAFIGGKPQHARSDGSLDGESEAPWDGLWHPEK
jgi:hypothetical protein